MPRSAWTASADSLGARAAIISGFRSINYHKNKWAKGIRNNSTGYFDCPNVRYVPGQQSSQAFGPTTGIKRAAEMFVCRLFSSLTVSRISDHSIVKPRADILHMKFFTLFWLDMVCILLKDHLLSFLFISFFLSNALYSGARNFT